MTGLYGMTLADRHPDPAFVRLRTRLRSRQAPGVLDPQPLILVFRSARPGASFEAWLLRKPPPETRRAVTAAIAVMLPSEARCDGNSGRCRRPGPGLYQLQLPVRRPASRPRSGSPGRPSGRLLDISVLFTRAGSTSVILHGDAAVTTLGALARALGTAITME